jgi:predicted transposase/invertase (TIGR01784 family)
LGVGVDYIYHGTTSFRGLHHKDELELSPNQKAEFGKLEIKDIYPEFYLLKVDRFSNEVRDKIDEWMYLFKNSKIEPDFAAPGLKEASEVLEYSSLSYEEQQWYDKYVDILRSNESSLRSAKQEGKAEGELIGEARGIEKEKINSANQLKAEKINIARQLKAKNMSIDLISEVTGLPRDELFQLPHTKKI